MIISIFILIVFINYLVCIYIPFKTSLFKQIFFLAIVIPMLQTILSLIFGLIFLIDNDEVFMGFFYILAISLVYQIYTIYLLSWLKDRKEKGSISKDNKAITYVVVFGYSILQIYLLYNFYSISWI